MADPPATRTKILYIDDDETRAGAFCEVLADAVPDAFSVVRARGVTATLSELDGSGCVVLAVGSLDEEALASIRSLFSRAPLRALVVTSDDDLEDGCARALEAGATDYLVQGTFTTQELMRIVRKAIVRKRIQLSLAEAQAVAKFGSWELDVVSGALTCSAELCRLFDLPADVRPTKGAMLARIHPNDRDALVLALQSAVAAASSITVDCRLVLADGSIRWLASRGRVEVDADGRASKILAVAHDVTDEKLAAKRLRYSAFIDPLTGLPNRLAAVHRLANALDRLEDTQLVVGVIYLDVDRFQSINDSLGHNVGNQLLVAVAERLTLFRRRSDVLARVEGDEFMVLCEGLSSVDEVVLLADELRAALLQPIAWREGAVTLTVSAGVAISADPMADPEHVLRDATAAVYRAKSDGRARTVVFDASVRATATERLETEAALRRSITDGELRLHYQPIVDLDDGHTVGFEALVRWQHPQRGLLAPDQFISLAEETGLIVPLGAWVLREACRQAVRFHQIDPTMNGLTMSVNLSGCQLVQADLVALVRRTLDETRLAPEHLQLEMTESVLMDDAAEAETVLRTLKGLGLRLAIDDFGTGFSSLAYLKRFPVDLIKIDRSFVSGLGEDREDSAIVATVMNLADALGMAVVAEGVETQLQRDCLLDIGCTRAQGYLFSKPVDALSAESALRASLAAAGPGQARRTDVGRVRSRRELEALQRELRAAIAGDELRCLVQPIVSLVSGSIEGVEATLRWSHPSMPPSQLTSYLCDNDPLALLANCTVALNLLGARRTIAAAHDAGVPVLVGGRGFGTAVRASALGADAWALDAPSAAAIRANGSLGRPRLASSDRVTSEQAELEIPAAELVERCLRHMEVRSPAIQQMSDAQRARTREDIGYILRCCSAAIAVGDRGVLDEFTLWLCDVLTLRGVPASLVAGSYDAIADELALDFPVASAMVAGASALVDQAT